MKRGLLIGLAFFAGGIGGPPELALCREPLQDAGLVCKATLAGLPRERVLAVAGEPPVLEDIRGAGALVPAPAIVDARPAALAVRPASPPAQAAQCNLSERREPPALLALITLTLLALAWRRRRAARRA